MINDDDHDEIDALRRIAGELDATAASLERRSCGASAFGGMPQPEEPDAIIAAARALYRARRLRTRHFGSLGGVFGEPMWDMMLDLFVSTREGRRVSTTSACIAAEVPQTTALRWLTIMEIEQIVVRELDPHDGRRNYVRLSDTAQRAMETYISDLLTEGAFGSAQSRSSASESA